MRFSTNKPIPVLWGVLAIVLTVIFAVTIGSANITPLDSLKIILNRVFGIFNNTTFPINSHIIILNVRLPRVLGAALSGIGLTVAGIIYQSILRNPMAEPYVLGVSSGAALGAAMSIILNLFITPLFALTGALLSSFLVIFISGNSAKSNRILLYGISFNFFLSSLLTLLISFNHKRASDIMFWTMGSFATMNYRKVLIIFFVIVIVITLTWILRKELNIFTLGSDTAKSLGLNVKKYRVILLTIASITTGIIVSFCGVIGFVGLIIPHLSRIFVGSEHKKVLSFSIPLGGIFMVICDTIARNILVNELPVGVITSLIGAPIFVYLLRVRSKR